MLIDLAKLAAASGDPDLLAKLMIAAVPIGGALGAAFASLWGTGRTVYVNTIVSERTKALGELRDQLADFSIALSVVGLERDLMNEAAKASGKKEVAVTIEKVTGPFEKLGRLENQICLRLDRKTVCPPLLTWWLALHCAFEGCSGGPSRSSSQESEPWIIIQRFSSGSM